jgi:prepilin-type N-terminal cleavage/methylation domain-containing protein
MNNRTRKGFTLIEILVVLSIVAMLIGITAFALGKFRSQGEVAKTQAIITSMGNLLEQYRTNTGDYPPSNLASFGIRGTKALFEGNEAMVVAMFRKDYSGSRPEESMLANLDDDTADKNITIFDKPALFEIVDAWGNPLVYLRHDSYETSQEYESLRQIDGELVRAQVKGVRSDKTGSFHNKEKYQLSSAGEDGVHGTEDDIASWK